MTKQTLIIYMKTIGKKKKKSWKSKEKPLK